MFTKKAEFFSSGSQQRRGVYTEARRAEAHRAAAKGSDELSTITQHHCSAAMSEKQRGKLHKMHARWVAKKNRPPAIVEDKEYHEIWHEALSGS